MFSPHPPSYHSGTPTHPAVSTSPQALYRRILFPTLPITSTTPALFACDSPDLSVATYNLIALLLRAHINPWYTKLTRDKTFVPHVGFVLAHTLREIESRAARADLPLLIYTALPTLITHHYLDYRSALLRTTFLPSAPLSEIFHSLQPHVALSPSGSEPVNVDYLRQSAEHIMRECIPAEDWKAETERSIVREVVVGPVLSGLLIKIAQPWFLFNIALSVLGKPKGKSTPVPPATHPPMPFSARYVLVLLIAWLHSITSALHSFLAFLQSASHFLASIPPRGPSREANTAKSSQQLPNYAVPGLNLIAVVLDLRSRLLSSLLLSYFGVIMALSQSLLDRLLPHVLYAYVLTPDNLAKGLNTASQILFPNGEPAPPQVEPTQEEQVAIREALEARLLELFPGSLSSIVLGPTVAHRCRTIRAALDPLSDASCNAHLVMRIFDALHVCVFPDLAANTMSVADEFAVPVDPLPTVSDVEKTEALLLTPEI